VDLAVLRIKDGRERFPAIEFSDSDALQVGDIGARRSGNRVRGWGRTGTHRAS